MHMYMWKLEHVELVSISIWTCAERERQGKAGCAGAARCDMMNIADLSRNVQLPWVTEK